MRRFVVTLVALSVAGCQTLGTPDDRADAEADASGGEAGPERPPGACLLVGDPTVPDGNGCCPAGFGTGSDHEYYPGGTASSGLCPRVILDESLDACERELRCHLEDGCYEQEMRARKCHDGGR